MTGFGRRLSAVIVAFGALGCRDDLAATSPDASASADAATTMSDGTPPSPADTTADLPPEPEPPRTFPTLPGPRCVGDESVPEAPCPGECRDGVCLIGCGGESPGLPTLLPPHRLASFTCVEYDRNVVSFGLAGHSVVYELVAEPTPWIRRRDLDTGGSKAIETPGSAMRSAHHGLEVAPDGVWIATFGREGAAFLDGDGGPLGEVMSVGRLHDVVALDHRKAIFVTDNAWKRVDLTLVSLDDGSSLHLSSFPWTYEWFDLVGAKMGRWLVVGNDFSTRGSMNLDELFLPLPLSTATWTDASPDVPPLPLLVESDLGAFRLEPQALDSLWPGRIDLAHWVPSQGPKRLSATPLAALWSGSLPCSGNAGYYDDSCSAPSTVTRVLADRGLVVVAGHGMGRVQPVWELPSIAEQRCTEAGVRSGRYCAVACDAGALATLDAAIGSWPAPVTVACTDLSPAGTQLLPGPPHVALAVTPAESLNGPAPPGAAHVARWVDARATMSTLPPTYVSSKTLPDTWSLLQAEFTAGVKDTGGSEELVTKYGVSINATWGCPGLTAATRLADGRHVAAADSCVGLVGPGVFLLGPEPGLPRLLTKDVGHVERLIPGPGYVIALHEKNGLRRYLALPVVDEDAAPTDVLVTSTLAAITRDGRYLTLLVLPDGRRTVRLATPVWQGAQLLVQGGDTLATGLTLRSATTSQVAREIVLGFDEGVAFLTY